MTEVLSPQSTIAIEASIPEIVRSCLLVPTQVPGEGETDDEIWLPTAPGVDYESLPPPPVIVDTSPNEMVGCIESTGDNPQVRLNALFPAPSEGDGVIERLNNDIWVYRTDEWINVGPNPGPTVVIEELIPFWNEKVIAIGLTRTFTSVQSLAYGLNLFAEVEAITKTGITARITRLFSPSTSLNLVINTPLATWAGQFPRTGAAVPLSPVNISGGIPSVLMEERATEDYWSSWSLQNYAWDIDLYPDTWAS